MQQRRAARQATSLASSSFTTRSTNPSGRIACRIPPTPPWRSPWSTSNPFSAARALAMGVEVKRGVGGEGFDQSEDDVVVRAGRDAFRGRWLVGADGGRSTVRKHGGFEFVGTEPEFTGYSVEVEMEPNRIRHPSGSALHAHRHVHPSTTRDDRDGRLRRRRLPPNRVPSGANMCNPVLRRVSGTDVTVTALKLATTWTDRAFHATTYRHRRVLLVGDAAPIHSPPGRGKASTSGSVTR